MSKSARTKGGPDPIAQVAREKLGFEALRPGQREAVQALLDRHDALVVQPTGSGKSAIYQIAGLMIEGSTVIISPLIALQKDQVDSIREQDAAEAVTVNSTKRASELREALNRIEEGAIEYIFLAPEQLRKEETMQRLKVANISLFVIDEAHCISEWGHDFRPDYLQIGPAIEALGHPRVLAMTATASPEVRKEIAERLGMKRPKIFVLGFDRPNIYLRVDRFATEQDKREALLRRIRFADKPGIVYVATRKTAQDIMAALAEEGTNALFYHGGLKPKERHAIQRQFMSGDADVIVATNAFGMGVDKADVRFVYHFDVSDSLDAYYQEIGRAGRDGERAEAVLFYRPENIGTQRFRTGEGKLEPAKVQKVLEMIAREDGSSRPQDIAAEAGLSQRKLASALNRLEDVGALEALPEGEVRLSDDVDLVQAAEAAAEEQVRHAQIRRERLDRMRDYAESTECRREILLRYFDDDFSGPCGNCDNCETENPATAASRDSAGTRMEVV